MNEPRKIGRASLLLIKIILRMGWVGFGRKGLLTLQCTKQSQQEREREREREIHQEMQQRDIDGYKI